MNYWYLLAIPAYKFISNAYYLWQTKKLHKEYLEWVLSGNNNVELYKRKFLFKDLINKADIKELLVPIVQNLGTGRIMEAQIPVSSQFPTKIESFYNPTRKVLLEAEGIFESRMQETFNPLYWVRLVMFLPKEATTYLGIKPEHMIVKIFQLIWFIAVGSYSLLLALYPDIFRNLIEKAINLIR